MNEPNLTVGSVVFDNAPRLPNTVNISVKHNHAPTSEHLALLRQMREEIEGEILHHFDVRDNSLSVAGFVARVPYPHPEIKITAIYKLNGKEYTCKGTVNYTEYQIKGLQYVGELLAKDIAQQVTQEILNALAPKFMEAVR